MPIGVSFTGFDGKKRSAVVKSTDELQKFMGGGGQRSRAQSQISLPEKPDPVDGPLIGIEGNGVSEPDGHSRPVGAAGGWRIPITRTEMSVKPSLEMKCNQVTLTKLEYDLIISEKGFVKGRTVERKVWSKSFFVISDKKDKEQQSNGVYCVRPFWDFEFDEKPVLQRLAFGTENDLNSYDKESGEFACNHVDGDLSKEKKTNPPVKIVETASCTYNPTT